MMILVMKGKNTNKYSRIYRNCKESTLIEKYARHSLQKIEYLLWNYRTLIKINFFIEELELVNK